MGKPSKNRVLIEHVGTATIYFDRDADASAHSTEPRGVLQSTLRTVTRLKAELLAAEQAHRDAQKNLDAYLKENAVPGTLEELIAISRPVKRAKKGR